MNLSSLLKLLMFFFKGDGAFLKGGSVAVRSLFQAIR